MEEYIRNEIEEAREMNKMSLDTFVFDKHNILDSPVDRLIINLKNEVNRLYSEHDKFIEMSEKDPNKYHELDEIAQRTGHSLSLQLYGYIEDAFYLGDEIYALYEMKIIYAFKHLEINIKRLISAAYEDKSVNRQFNWINLKQYLNLKGIDLQRIEGYSEVDQLREVNNSLKHSDELRSGAQKNYPEFKDQEQITYHNLEIFYNRIVDFPKVFLSSLASELFNDLYEFTDVKIQSIAKTYALRMDEDVAMKFSKALLNLYK